MVRVLSVRVLLIDDDPDVCRRVGGWLRADALDVVTFTEPAAALAHVARAPCRVGLVDLRLADRDGAGVIAELRQVAPEMRLIALAAFPDVPQVVAAMRAGAVDLLEKPIREPALREALHRQLAVLGAAVRNEDEYNRRLGARVRAARVQAQRTLQQVAAQCGLTAAQVSQIELGKTATSTWTLARLCAALDTTPDRILANL